MMICIYVGTGKQIDELEIEMLPVAAQIISTGQWVTTLRYPSAHTLHKGTEVRYFLATSNQIASHEDLQEVLSKINPFALLGPPEELPPLPPEPPEDWIRPEDEDPYILY